MENRQIKKVDNANNKDDARDIYCPISPKPKKPALIENIHFYMEGKFCVFTEFYHLQRGYCCKSGCRHCPYPDESVS